MTFNSQNQTHIAQQFRREKLRIPGTQPPVSPQRDEDSNQMSRSRSSMEFPQSPHELKRAKTFNAFGFSSEFEASRAGSMLSNAVDDVGQAYNTGVMPSESFNFLNGAGSVYGSQSLYPREISTQLNRSSNPSNWGLGLHGQMPQNFTGSVFVAVESSNFQNNINNDHQAQDTPAVEAILASTNLHNRCIGDRKKDLGVDPYVESSNNQSQALQLCGMNQDFHIYPDSVQGNVLLVGPNPGGDMESHQTVSGHETVPARAFAQIQLPHQATMPAMPVAQQAFQSNLLVPHMGNQNSNNWQNGGNEVLFVPMPGCTESNHQGTAEPYQALNFGHTSTWAVPDYDTRRSSVLQGPDKTLIRGGMGQCLHRDQSHNANNGQYQGLALSLSSHQPSAMQLNSFQIQPPSAEHATNSSVFSHTLEDAKAKLSHGLSNRFHMYINPLQNSRDLFLASDLKNEDSKVLVSAKQFNYNSGLSTLSSSSRMLSSSKYLKVVHHLLNEVCSVVGPVEKDGNSSRLTENKPHEWMVSKSSPYGSLQNENKELEPVKKDVPNLGAAATAPSISSCAENATALTQEERQNFQIRKTKLLSMLQEVDRQYRQYYDHMQTVVFSFDSAIGQVGAARPYTRLALKAMSRHFRSLRDTISNQVQITCKALGEEDISEPGPLRKVTSRLRFVDQQLRQQRALQQLGMLQQPAWRPQRGLPEHSVSILRAWLFEHFLHPYPKDADKMMLARQTGLSRSQVSNWFINARVRLWKPMVEEMYTEENREDDQEASVKRVNQQTDNGISCEQNICENRDGNSIPHKGMLLDESKENQEDLEVHGKVRTEGHRHHGSFDTKSAESDYVLRRITQPDITNVQASVSSPDSGMLEEGMNRNTDMSFRQNVHQAYSSGFLNSSVFDKSMHLRPKDTVSETLYEDEYKVRSSKGYSTYPFSVQNANTFLHHTSTSDAYNIGDRNLNVYSHMDVAPNIFGSAGVSLTLGLQHVDNLSQATSHNYVHSAHNLTESDGAHDFHLNVISHPGDSDHLDGHESLNFQSGKHVATHLLREFVA